jgi:hypothetical protein
MLLMKYHRQADIRGRCAGCLTLGRILKGVLPAADARRRRLLGGHLPTLDLLQIVVLR